VWYNNPAYDKLYAQSARTTGAPRLAALKKMQQIAMTDLPKIPIAQLDSQIAVGKNITGWEGDTQDLLRFWNFKPS
jgi:ABC-type transport system substrate-binding protein